MGWIGVAQVFRPRFGTIVLSTMALLFFSEAVGAQQGQINGRVLSAESAAPLNGAQVVVVGTGIGTITDGTGRYRLTGVPGGVQQVRVVMLGFSTTTERVTVAAGETATLDFSLPLSAISMEEMVVTTTGQQRRREVANAVSDIKAAGVTATQPVKSVSDLLSGRASGVVISGSSGVSGTGTRIRIRGASTVSLNNAPLIYIDGARVSSDENGSTLNVGGQTTSRLDDLNPDDIESIEIVKGPSAATLYGTQAANGVIRITTKKGRGAARAQVWSEYGRVQDRNDYPGLWRAVDAAGKACPLVSMGQGACSISDVQSFNLLMDPTTRPFRTGDRVTAGASLSGSTSGTNYFLSAETEHENGTLPNNKTSGASARLNVGMQPIENVTLTVSSGFRKREIRLPNNDNSSLGIQAQGLLGSNPSPDGWWRFTPQQLYQVLTYQDVNRFTGSSTVNWEAKSWLSFRGSFGLDMTDQEDTQYIPPGVIPRGADILGLRVANRLRTMDYTAEFNGTATKSLTGSLSSQTSVGVQFFHDKQSGTLSQGQNLVAGSNSLAAAATTTANEFTKESKTLGVYAQEQLGYADRLFLTGAVRGDDNSAFGQNFNGVIYPKVSASWVLSEEPFFPNSSWLSSLRLRAAYGASGNQPGVTDALRYLVGVPVTTSDAQDAIGVTYDGGGLGNPDLKPERSSELETGLDASLWGDRLSLELTFYNKLTRDALIFRDVAPSVGTVAGRFENLGRTRNRGWEVGLNATLLDRTGLQFSLTVNASRNSNELLALGEGVAPLAVDGGITHQAGYPLGSYFEKPILSWGDANGDGIIVPSEVTVGPDQVFFGPSLATTELSILPQLRLADRVTISGTLTHRGGNYVDNQTGSFRCARANDRARNDPTVSLWEQARCVASFFYGTEAGYIEKGDFTRLQELSLSFDVPPAWVGHVGADRASFTLSGHNLAVWTSYTGTDPEVTRYAQSNFGNAEFLTVAPPTYWTARLSLGF